MSFWNRLMPRDCVAMILVVIAGVLIMQGHNGTLAMILVGIATFYFGAEILKEKPRLFYG